MAHSIEGRVPFLDLEMIELALRVPAGLKLFGDPPQEKWILRKSFEGLLPDEILWRRKAQFDEGSGAIGLLREAVSRIMPIEEAEAYRAAHAEARLRSAEECCYHKLLTDVFRDPRPVLENVARWTDRPSWGNDGPAQTNGEPT
jgi:asparagine synthase (glutamine-hydrolysing)